MDDISLFNLKKKSVLRPLMTCRREVANVPAAMVLKNDGQNISTKHPDD